MTFDSVVDLQISIQNVTLSLPGFRLPLIMGPVHSFFSGRVKAYGSVSEMLSDGFGETDDVVQEAAAVFSQNPSPSQVKIGRRLAAVAQVDTIRVNATDDGTYTVQVNGQNASFVASSSTATAIRDGLVSAINGLSVLVGETDVVAAPSGTTDLTLTASSAGIQFLSSLSGPTSSSLQYVQTVDGSGGGADGAYSINIGTVSAAFNAVGATAAAIRDGLVSAVDANTLTTGVDAVANGATDLDLLSSTQFSVVLSSPGSALTISGKTANQGLPEDIRAATEEDNDWYSLLITDRDDASILSASRYIQTVRKMFFAQSSSAAILTTPHNASAPPHILSKLLALAHIRTSLWFTRTDTNRVAAGVVGKQLPKTPGSTNWAFQQISGVQVDDFTTNEWNNLESARGNGYRSIGGRGTTQNGYVSDGSNFIDTIRGVDDLYQDISSEIFTLLSRSEKIDYTQAGINLIAGVVRTSLDRSVTNGLIAESRVNQDTGDDESPAYTVSPPSIGDIPSSVRGSRVLTSDYPITFEATAAAL